MWLRRPLSHLLNVALRQALAESRPALYAPPWQTAACEAQVPSNVPLYV